MSTKKGGVISDEWILVSDAQHGARGGIQTPLQERRETERPIKRRVGKWQKIFYRLLLTQLGQEQVADANAQKTVIQSLTAAISNLIQITTHQAGSGMPII